MITLTFRSSCLVFQKIYAIDDPRYRDYGLALGLLATSCCKVQAPLSEGRVSSMRAENVVRTLDQQTSEIGVAGLGDPELRIVFAGLTAPWSQAEVTAHITTSTETLLVAQREDECKSGDVTDAVDGQQRLSLGILGLSHPLDLPVILLDLQRHLRDLLEYRTERQLESRWHRCVAALCKTPRRRGRHTVATSLRQPTNGVHRRCAQSDQELSRTDQCESFLLLDGTMRNRPQDLWIETRIAG